MNNENDDFKHHLKDDNFDDCPGYYIGYCKDGRCYDKSGSFIGSITNESIYDRLELL